jgi:hypothetical protein
MSKHIAPDCLITLPSNDRVHPCRLILKDGTLMWKHALFYQDSIVCTPTSVAHESHIIKTAQRLEELNSWISQGLEPWNSFTIKGWYQPFNPELNEGISVFFKHSTHELDFTFENLLPHIQDHETLELRKRYLFFQRC